MYQAVFRGEWKIYSVMMWVEVVLLILVLKSVACYALTEVNMSPKEHTAVPINSTELVQFHCEANEGEVFWEVRGHQLQDRDLYRSRGVIIEVADNLTYTNLTLSKPGLDLFQQNLLPIRCYVSFGVSVEPVYTNYSYVIRYGAPEPPLNVQLLPTPSLHLLWQRPSNMHPMVPVEYRVDVVNMNTMNVVQTATVLGNGDGGSFTFTENATNSCQLHEFRVSSVNDAGTSEPAIINETIPITPNIENVSRSLDAVPLLDGGFRISVSFEPATTCNPDTFPVEQYIISIEQLPGNLTLPAEGSGTITAVLNSTNFPGLAEGSYTVSVQACASFACRMAEPQTVVTSDVQRANITFLNTTVSLYCVFADSGSARGCRFILSLADGTREEVDVSRPMAGGTVSMQCGETQNRREAYASIQVFDLESNGTTGTLAIDPRVEETMNAEDILPCEPPTAETEIIREDTGLSAGEIAAIIIVILVVLAIVISVLAVIIWWKRREIHDWFTTDELELMVKEEDDKPTIEMLMKGIHGTGTFKRKAMAVSHTPERVKGRIRDDGAEEEPVTATPPVSTKDPVAMIKVKDASDPNHLNLVFKAANLAHLVRKWKEKSRNADEIPLYVKMDEDD